MTHILSRCAPGSTPALQGTADSLSPQLADSSCVSHIPFTTLLALLPCCCHFRGLTHRLPHARAGLPHLPGDPGLGRCHRPGLLPRLQRPVHRRTHACPLQPTLVRACACACACVPSFESPGANINPSSIPPPSVQLGPSVGGPSGPIAGSNLGGGCIAVVCGLRGGSAHARYLHRIERCLLPAPHHTQVLPHAPHRPPGRSKPAAEDPWERRCTDLRGQRQQHTRSGNGGNVCSRL